MVERYHFDAVSERQGTEFFELPIYTLTRTYRRNRSGRKKRLGYYCTVDNAEQAEQQSNEKIKEKNDGTVNMDV